MRYSKQMEEEKPLPEEKKPETAKEGPVYNFEGFKVVMNEKVSLTPIEWSKRKKNG